MVLLLVRTSCRETYCRRALCSRLNSLVVSDGITTICSMRPLAKHWLPWCSLLLGWSCGLIMKEAAIDLGMGWAWLAYKPDSSSVGDISIIYCICITITCYFLIKVTVLFTQNIILHVNSLPLQRVMYYSFLLNNITMLILVPYGFTSLNMRYCNK